MSAAKKEKKAPKKAPEQEPEPELEQEPEDETNNKEEAEVVEPKKGRGRPASKDKSANDSEVRTETNRKRGCRHLMT